MLGSATFTIVTSSTTMNCAAQQIASTAQVGAARTAPRRLVDGPTLNKCTTTLNRRGRQLMSSIGRHLGYSSEPPALLARVTSARSPAERDEFTANPASR